MRHSLNLSLPTKLANLRSFMGGARIVTQGWGAHGAAATTATPLAPPMRSFTEISKSACCFHRCSERVDLSYVVMQVQSTIETMLPRSVCVQSTDHITQLYHGTLINDVDIHVFT